MSDTPELLTTKYLRFFDITPHGRKTKIISIGPINDNMTLGLIKWHGAWRKYCFFPSYDVLYDTNCLKDVISFIDQLMSERKEKL